MVKAKTNGEFMSDEEIFLKKIQAKRKEVEAAKMKATDAKETAKLCKEEWEVEVGELDELIQASEKTPLEEYAERSGEE